MKKQSKVVLFLIKFFAGYFLLFVIYSFYLQQSQVKNESFQCDGLTVKVAHQTKAIISTLGYDIETAQHPSELSMKLILNKVYVARVIEGCNSFSVIALFLAFIVAFQGSLKNTILFGVLGSLIIYFTNIARIAVLTILLYEFPKAQTFLHNLVFPAIIYGMTFLLWLIWVQKLSYHKK